VDPGTWPIAPQRAAGTAACLTRPAAPAGVRLDHETEPGRHPGQADDPDQNMVFARE